MIIRPSQSGFSLVELSIVLVILGLLTGGILAGQSLIRASELRSVTAQYSTLNGAINSFRDKYMMLPGDMTNATAFWGVEAGSVCSGNPGAQSAAAWDTPRTTTCNGNGDGNWDDLEKFRSFQQLANAGLIEGIYTGSATFTYPDVSSSCGCHNWKSGLNGLSAKINGVGWAAYYRGGTGSYGYPQWMMNSNILIVGRDTSDHNFAGFMTAAESWNIDTKIDDGRPSYGQVVVGFTTSCVTNTWQNNPAIASYVLSSSVADCYSIFRLN